MPRKDPAARREYNAAYTAINREKLSAYHKEHYVANREKKRERNRQYSIQNKWSISAKKAEYHAANRDVRLAKSKEYYASNVDKFRTYGRSRRYGLDQSEFDAIFSRQNGRCAVCGVSLEPNGRHTHIDHCHTSGKVRGILCHHCNAALGYAKDNPETLRRAAKYIEDAWDAPEW